MKSLSQTLAVLALVAGFSANTAFARPKMDVNGDDDRRTEAVASENDSALETRTSTFGKADKDAREVSAFKNHVVHLDDSTEVREFLSWAKGQLRITPTQEAAWNKVSSELIASSQKASAEHRIDTSASLQAFESLKQSFDEGQKARLERLTRRGFRFVLTDSTPEELSLKERMDSHAI